MPAKLGLISDVHASPASLQEALEIFARENVSDIVCAGDVAGTLSGIQMSTPQKNTLIYRLCRKRLNSIFKINPSM
jgi:predicted phosphodiesterase